MNKDKIIKDLKERNDKLENQRRQFEARLYHEQYLSKRKDEEIKKLNKEKDDIFNKAVEINNKLRDSKNREIDIMKKYFQMIIDLGYDYDGFNNVKDLKGLIDALCKYASLGKECNTTEIIYVNGNKKYNILDEELKEGNDKK